MIIYPNFVAAIAGRDVDELGAAAGLTVAELEALIAGGRSISPATRERLARILDANPIELFHAFSRLSSSQLVDLEPALPANRYVTDPATLRTIDRARS
jgi:plasmid maintenance system antidote protein VapI